MKSFCRNAIFSLQGVYFYNSISFYLFIFLYYTLMEFLGLTDLVCFLVMCDIRAHAGAYVKAQGVCPESEGLPEDDVISEMAEDGCPAG